MLIIELKIDINDEAGFQTWTYSFATVPMCSTNPSSFTWKTVLSLSLLLGITLAFFTVALKADLKFKVQPVICPPSPASNPSRCPSPSTSESSSVSFSYFAMSPQIVDVNFYFRYVNGNRRRNGIKMAHINLGSGYVINQINSIEAIVGGYKPHILGISECSFKKTHDKNDATIEDYTTYFSKTLENDDLNVSRITVYTHKELVVKERTDLMTDTFSTIWLELGLPRKRKILVCDLYRDLQYLDKDSNESLSSVAQISRWLSFLDQWEAAMVKNKEIHIVVDKNLDFLKWDDPSQPGSHQRNRLHKLSHAVFDRVFPLGFVQLITAATWFWPGQESTGLDHWYTNKPGKLSVNQINNHGGSDHKLLFAIRYSTSVISKPKIIKKNCYKHFDPLKFLTEIKSIS